MRTLTLIDSHRKITVPSSKTRSRNRIISLSDFYNAEISNLTVVVLDGTRISI